MIVTIDGPAGAGKSSVAKQLAKRLGFDFLDTGAMYRAVTWAAIRENIDLDDVDAVVEIARTFSFEFDDSRFIVNGQVVTTEIRSQLITKNVSRIADNQAVRTELVERQREIGKHGNYVCEGRDQGTVVFPYSKCKIFLNGSSEQRARRRWLEMKASGHEGSLEEVLREQQRRDKQDYSRPVGALSKADDAIEVLTDGMTLEQVVDRLEEIVRSKMESED